MLTVFLFQEGWDEELEWKKKRSGKRNTGLLGGETKGTLGDAFPQESRSPGQWNGPGTKEGWRVDAWGRGALAWTRRFFSVYFVSPALLQLRPVPENWGKTPSRVPGGGADNNIDEVAGH